MQPVLKENQLLRAQNNELRQKLIKLENARHEAKQFLQCLHCKTRMDAEMRADCENVKDKTVNVVQRGNPHTGEFILKKEVLDFLQLPQELKDNMRKEKQKRIKEVTDEMYFIVDEDYNNGRCSANDSDSTIQDFLKMSRQEQDILREEKRKRLLKVSAELA